MGPVGNGHRPLSASPVNVRVGVRITVSVRVGKPITSRLSIVGNGLITSVAVLVSVLPPGGQNQHVDEQHIQ